MKPYISYSLHDKCKPVTELSKYKKPDSIPKNYGHPMTHFPVVGEKLTMDANGQMKLMPIIGHAAPLTYRRMFTQPPPMWPHLRTEKRIKALHDKDGKTRYPALVSILTKQMEREKVEYTSFKEAEAKKNEQPSPVE